MRSQMSMPMTAPSRTNGASEKARVEARAQLAALENKAKEQKARTAAAEAKQRAVEPPPVAAAAAPYGSDRAPAGIARAVESKDAGATAASAAPTESSPAPAQVPSRLWPAAVSSVRDAPRPPLGVGEYLSGSM